MNQRLRIKSDLLPSGVRVWTLTDWTSWFAGHTPEPFTQFWSWRHAMDEACRRLSALADRRGRVSMPGARS